MDLKNVTISYFRLFRFQTTGLIATLFLIGAVVAGLSDPFLLFIIFLIGIFYHIYLYVLNDYVDLEVDKQSKDLQRKPLVSGMISPKTGLIIAIVTGILTYILTIIYFPYFNTILMLTFAVLLGAIYDCFGKKMPGLSDFTMAGSLAFAFLLGASTIPTPFTTITILVGLLIFIFVVYGNAVEGGLKDVDHDYLGGAKTLATVMGVKVKNEKLFLTKKFAIFSYGIEIFSFVLILLLAAQPEINIFDKSEYLKLIIVIILIIVTFISSVRFLSLKKFDRALMKKLFAVINSSSGALIIIMIFPIIGLEKTIILLLLPITWYIIFNTILYGKPMQPDI
jgi:4-hydroxybenzoate polyprenyltransferase